MRGDDKRSGELFSAKFAELEGPDIQHEGYATRDDYPKGGCFEWVCQTCFDDLKDEMNWSATGG